MLKKNKKNDFSNHTLNALKCTLSVFADNTFAKSVWKYQKKIVPLQSEN